MIKRYRINYSKEGEMIFISHLSLLRLFSRVIRRSSLPCCFSEGFNPHIKISFGPPLPLGIIGKDEYLDIFLQESCPEEEIKDKINYFLPDGIKIKKVKEININSKNLMNIINSFEYSLKKSLQTDEIYYKDFYIDKHKIIIKIDGIKNPFKIIEEILNLNIQQMVLMEITRERCFYKNDKNYYNIMDLS